ncbi:MAG: hypothetical protein JXB88_14180 [Spirochaetales bacterium]|nr:hypothetical protein [Spirochaetales bacterium]
MKIFFRFLIILLFIIPASPVCSDDSTDLVPRRIYIENRITSTENSLLLPVPGMLFSLITSIEPVIQVKEKDRANSIITAMIQKKSDKKIELIIQLYENGKRIKSSEFIYEKENLKFNKLHLFLKSTAEDFAGFLGPVKPETVMIDLIQDETTKRDFSEIEFEKSLSYPFELTLWSSIVYKSMDIQDNADIMRLYFVAPLPLWLDFAWKFDRNQAVYVSLRMDYNTYQYFDYENIHDMDGSERREIKRSENFSIYGGIGYMFKPPGKFSAGFSLSLYLGGINIKAVDSISYESDGLSLEPGESEWVMDLFFSLQLISSYNITKYFSVHARTGIFLGLTNVFSLFGAEQYYEAGSSAGGVEILSIGVSYRL